MGSCFLSTTRYPSLSSRADAPASGHGIRLEDWGSGLPLDEVKLRTRAPQMASRQKTAREFMKTRVPF